MNQTTKPTVLEVLPLVRAYYEKSDNIVGGNLHLILDDANVEDQHVLFCLGIANERNDDDGVRIAELLLRMSKTQRYKIARSPQKRNAVRRK
jgi:hypothetical protein